MVMFHSFFGMFTRGDSYWLGFQWIFRDSMGIDYNYIDSVSMAMVFTGGGMDMNMIQVE